MYACTNEFWRRSKFVWAQLHGAGLIEPVFYVAHRRNFDSNFSACFFQRISTDVHVEPYAHTAHWRGIGVYEIMKLRKERGRSSSPSLLDKVREQQWQCEAFHAHYLQAVFPAETPRRTWRGMLFPSAPVEHIASNAREGSFLEGDLEASVEVVASSVLADSLARRPIRFRGALRVPPSAVLQYHLSDSH
jgi:hypothetical protein